MRIFCILNIVFYLFFSSLVFANDNKNEVGFEQKQYPNIRNNCIQRNINGRPPISMWYPVLGQRHVDEDIRHWATLVVNSYEDDVDNELTEAQDRESISKWSFEGFFEITKPSVNVISVIFYISSYTGGVHGNLSITSLNYDLITGRRIEFNDMFLDPSKALEILSIFTKNALLKKLGDDADKNMIEDGTVPDADNFSVFSITNSGLTVYFQPYQVGPWAIGYQTVDVPLQELSSVGPQKSIWNDAQTLPLELKNDPN